MILVTQLCISAFFAILFLQSGIDKITDRKGNLGFYATHFANSPLKSLISPLLTLLSMMEVACGLLFVAGMAELLLKGSVMICVYANMLAMIDLVSLFLGQRLAKDYKGAATIVSYFILSIVAMIMFS